MRRLREVLGGKTFAGSRQVLEHDVTVAEELDGRTRRDLAKNELDHVTRHRARIERGSREHAPRSDENGLSLLRSTPGGHVGDPRDALAVRSLEERGADVDR